MSSKTFTVFFKIKCKKKKTSCRRNKWKSGVLCRWWGIYTGIEKPGFFSHSGFSLEVARQLPLTTRSVVFWNSASYSLLLFFCQCKCLLHSSPVLFRFLVTWYMIFPMHYHQKHREWDLFFFHARAFLANPPWKVIVFFLEVY